MEDLIEMLRTGKLDFDCSKMVLTQNAASEPCVFRGPGYIRQGVDGGLSFRIYSSETQPSDSYHSGIIGPPGTLVSEDQFYTLQATVSSGKVWTCPRVMPESSVNYVDGKLVTVVGGELYAMTHTEPVKPGSNSTFVLHFFGDHDIPCNASTTVETKIANHRKITSSHLDLASFISCGHTFLLSRKPGQLIVESRSASMPANFDQRITETLRFILAKPLQLRALERVHAGTKTLWLASPQLEASGTRMKPPIHQLGGPAARYWTWVLFDRYLRFIQSRELSSWHPCSVHLASACEASSGSLDTECLSLAVAVEGVVNTLFPKIVKISKEFKTLVSGLCKHTEGWLKGNSEAESAGLPGRLLGIRGMLLDVRAVDRLQQLQRDGALEQRHVDEWKKLRNTTAHAAQPGTREWQELFDRRDVVLALLYRMVFHAIGYEGYCIDYGIRGWRPSIFPPMKTTEERSGNVLTFRTNALGRDLMWSGPSPEGFWDWEARLPGAVDAETKGTAYAQHQAIEFAFNAASAHKMNDEFNAANELPSKDG